MLRFAPSPTGDMHTESLRVAIFNYMVAQQRDEPFIVRIDDTDKACNIEGKDTEILQILEKFALKHDSVFHQSEHLNIHQTLAIRLLEEGKAFICTCTAEQIEADKAEAENTLYRYSGKCFEANKEELSRLKENKTPFVIRIKKPQSDIVFNDLIQGHVTADPGEADSFVILKADGTPTYNFACACDDMLSGVNFIIRAEEHLSDTPRQIYIKQQLGYEEETLYAHLPAILNTEGRKMGEGDDAFCVKWLFEQGFIPDAIANYLILLGNNTPQKIFTLPEALEWFELKNIAGSPAIFDIDTLRFLNRKHLERMDDKRLSMVFGFADEDIGRLAKLYLEEASTLNELERKIKAVFSPKDFSGKWGTQMRTLEKIIARAPMINTFDTFKAHLVKESGMEEEVLIKPLRILLTGAKDGPELKNIYTHIKSYLLEVAS